MNLAFGRELQRCGALRFWPTTSQQVDKRSDAIRKCGTEIVKLRKHIEDIDRDRCRLHSQLKTLHRTTAEAEMVRNDHFCRTREHDIGVTFLSCLLSVASVTSQILAHSQYIFL